jgi:RNA 2',3'-cyclic 3'-phosphodiesterase
MGKIRTFVAIELPGELKQAVDKLIVGLKPFGPDVRWVRAANLHFTLRFLGDVEQNDIAKLGEQIKRQLSGLPSFRIKLAGLGCFPNMRRPRVVWVGADGALDSLKALAGRVETACIECGFGKGDKPFSPHLTIGRIKDSRGLEPLVKRLEAVQFSSAEFTVEQVIIFKSDLSPRGPTYTPLAKLDLA